MATNQFIFTKPATWKVIKPEKYRDFSILSTESPKGSKNTIFIAFHF